MPRTSRTFCPKNCNILSVSSIFRYNSGKTNDKFITSQQFLSSDIIWYRRARKESDELLYTVRSLVMVRNQSPAQVINQRERLRALRREKNLSVKFSSSLAFKLSYSRVFPYSRLLSKFFRVSRLRTFTFLNSWIFNGERVSLKLQNLNQATREKSFTDIAREKRKGGKCTLVK